MKIIQDMQKIQKYTDRYTLLEQMHREGFVFQMQQYDRHELVTRADMKIKYLQFVVSGTIQIYGVRTDGTQFPVGRGDGFTILGDVEIMGPEKSMFLVEAMTEVICLAIPFEEKKEELLSCNILMRYLLASVSDKMVRFMDSQAQGADLREKLLYYLQNECENHEICGIETAIYALHCSRRQIQRVLSQLCTEGKLIHAGRGKYILKKT